MVNPKFKLIYWQYNNIHTIFILSFINKIKFLSICIYIFKSITDSPYYLINFRALFFFFNEKQYFSYIIFACQYYLHSNI